MIKLITILAGVFLMVSVCGAAEKTALTDKKAKNSYSLGYEFGNNLRTQEVELDENLLISALREALAGKEPAMKSGEMRDTLKQLRKEVLIRYNIKRNALADKNKREGEAFLAANKKKEGIVTLESGLQYQVIKEGSGPSPQAADVASVRYKGTLVNGMEFDTSGDGEPSAVKVNAMIPAWTEALQKMKTGAKWRLFVPADLAYGGRQYGKIPPNSALIFDLELVSVAKDDAAIEELEAGQSLPALPDKME